MTARGDFRIEATVTATTPDRDEDDNTAGVDLEVLKAKIRLLPAVARPGMVVLAYGENLPPRARLPLLWTRGITVDPGPHIVARDGTLRAALLVVRRDVLGDRKLEVSDPECTFSPVRGRLLVVLRLLTAPDFIGRG
jgi:hypothetical protein